MYTLNWGIMATGGISASASFSLCAMQHCSQSLLHSLSLSLSLLLILIEFAKDLLVNPATRNVTDLTHSIAAVGSSTSRQRAQDFVREHCAGHESNIACYGSYKEFLADKVSQSPSSSS